MAESEGRTPPTGDATASCEPALYALLRMSNKQTPGRDQILCVQRCRLSIRSASAFAVRTDPHVCASDQPHRGCSIAQPVTGVWVRRMINQVGGLGLLRVTEDLRNAVFGDDRTVLKRGHRFCE